VIVAEINLDGVGNELFKRDAFFLRDALHLAVQLVGDVDLD